MIEMTLNGVRHLTAAKTLAELLDESEFGPKVATARNNQFVPASLRAATPLAAGDAIEVLAAMQGG